MTLLSYFQLQQYVLFIKTNVNLLLPSKIIMYQNVPLGIRLRHVKGKLLPGVHNMATGSGVEIDGHQSTEGCNGFLNDQNTK